MKLYDWRTNHLILDGVLVTGYATGDDVLGIERQADSATSEVGADGRMTLSLHADKSIKVTLKLAQTSPMNAMLSTKCAAQDALEGFAPLVASWKDSYRNDSMQTTVGYVEKFAAIKRGTKANDTEWTLIFERGDLLLGNPAFAGLLTATSEALGG